MVLALTLFIIGVLCVLSVDIMLTADKRNEYVIDYDEENNGQ